MYNGTIYVFIYSYDGVCNCIYIQKWYKKKSEICDIIYNK